MTKAKRKIYLRRDRATVTEQLEMILKHYDAYRVGLKLDKESAIAETVHKYQDFFEWLQGKML